LKPDLKPKKPDRYVRGQVCIVNLPEQVVIEGTGEKRQRKGVEQHGPHHSLIISSEGFNDSQSRGVIVIPMTSAKDSSGKEKFVQWQPTWVRVKHNGEDAVVQCEQIRYADLGRCGLLSGKLVEFDIQQVEKKLRALLTLPQ